MSVDPRLSINQATIKYADLHTALTATVAAGFQAIGLWREPVGDVGLDRAARMLADSGLRFTSHCRGGFFTMTDRAEWGRSLDENRRAIDETATLAAAGAPEIGRASCRESEEISVVSVSRRRHTSCGRDWSSDVCSSDLARW